MEEEDLNKGTERGARKSGNVESHVSREESAEKEQQPKKKLTVN